ncbi:MAG: hypothetical protein MZW92_68820 [Comamonadaceae bacterium]|nr:hypothetical protein [Comamonadaceae bacterium]
MNTRITKWGAPSSGPTAIRIVTLEGLRVVDGLGLQAIVRHGFHSDISFAAGAAFIPF